jgi:hypothetical protein
LTLLRQKKNNSEVSAQFQMVSQTFITLNSIKIKTTISTDD